MSKNLRKYAFVWVTSFAPAFCAHADNAETANKSNNPLNLAPGINLQDYYTPKLFDTNAHTNDALLRGALPMAANDVIGVPQLLRVTLPVSARPDPHNGYSTGIGDLNVFDIFLLKTKGVQLGIGPQITAPTAEQDELGWSVLRDFAFVSAKTGSHQRPMAHAVADSCHPKTINGVRHVQASRSAPLVGAVHGQR